MNTTTTKILASIGGAAVLAVAGAGVAAAAPAPARTPETTVQSGKSNDTGDKPVKFFAGPMNIRYINKTDQEVCVKAIGTRMDWKGCLQPGSTSGYAQGMAWSGTDIWSDVTYADGSTDTMWAKNPEMGYPMIGFGTGWGKHQGYKVGESADWSYGGHKYTITRTDDGGYWKTFDIALQK